MTFNTNSFPTFNILRGRRVLYLDSSFENNIPEILLYSNKDTITFPL